MGQRKGWINKSLIVVICGCMFSQMLACGGAKKSIVKTESPITKDPTIEEYTSEPLSIEEAYTDFSDLDISTMETSAAEVSITEVPVTETTIIEVSMTETSATEHTTTEATTMETPTTEVSTTEASTTEAPTTETLIVQSICADVNGKFYIGDHLSASDFTVIVTMSDGTTRKNPAGWSADILYLSKSENSITVSYQEVSTVISVKATERPAETQPSQMETPQTESLTEAQEEVPASPSTQEHPFSGNEMSLRRDAAEEAFRIQNDLIVQNGGTPLTWSETFYQQACKRAQDIVTNFSHDGFYDTTAYAENIAMGSYDANVMVQAWYNSDGHRNNMLHGWAFGAIACYGYYWVALFGPTAG